MSRAELKQTPHPLRTAWRVTALLVLLAAGVWATVSGLQVRNWAWQASAPVRFQSDIRNGMNWGERVLRTGHERSDVAWESPGALTFGQFLGGYRALYDELAIARAAAEIEAESAETRRQRRRIIRIANDRLDYAPLRLLVMSSWMWQTRQTDPTVHGPRDYRDELVGPLLQFNLALGAAASLLMLGFVADWSWRCGRSLVQSATAGVGAGLLIWFSPAVILDAHAWPQWDVWALPFYTAAVWAASRNRPWLWFVAGVMVGVGAMLKGQLLMASAALSIWALVGGGWRGLPSLAGGFVTAWAIVTAVWLLDNTTAQLTAAMATALLAAGLWFVPKLSRSDRLLLGIGGAACIVFGAGYFFGGSFAWFHYGFANPTEQYERLAVGPVSNVPALLQERFGFELRDLVELPWWGEVELRSLLIAAGGTIILAAGALMGWQQRRRSPALLVVIALPWLAMFTLMPQMHERYLLWAAAISAAGAVYSLGGFTLHLGIGTIAATMIWHCMLDRDQAFAPAWLAFCQGTRPGFGYAVAVLLVANLVMAVSRDGVFRHRARSAPSDARADSSAGSAG